MSGSTAVRLPSVPSLSWDDCRLLVESVMDYAIFMLDVDGNVATWNIGAEKIKGYKAHEIIGHHFSKFYPAEDVRAGKPERELENARDAGRTEDEGVRIRKDGTRFWASVVITALRDADGKLRGFGKVTRDLTARREAEESLRLSEERFHHLVDAVTDYAIFLLDAEGRVATWNSGAMRLKGYLPAEILGKHFSVFYTEEDRAAGKPERILNAVRSTGRFEDEGLRERRDGTRFWANVVITALRNEAGEVTGFAKVTRDLSERRRVEEELRRSEERFRLMVDNIGDYAIYMLDPEGRVTTWNLGAERLTGYKAAEVIGTSFALFFPPDDVAAGKPTRELLAARVLGRFEDEGFRIHKDGTRFWANAVLTAIHDADGRLLGFAKITRDLTERRQAEEAERNLLAEQLASRTKDEFLATVSHELRTPLSAILGWSRILKERVTDENLVRPLEVIFRNAEAQVRIIEDVLDVSRVITGKLKLDMKPTDLVSIVRDALDVVRPAAAAKDIDLSFGHSEFCLLVADPDRLRQAAWNLLSNAVKFTETGGSVRVEIRQAMSTFVVTVTDTGQGIDAAFLPFVFDRFKQADSSTARRASGLGLGLALVRHIVELHGGTVSASSEGLGRGAAFSIVLPIRAVGQHEPERAAQRTADRFSGRLAGVRVLLVDDDADARELVGELLTAAGASVRTSGSAAEGYVALLAARPDVLVSDLGMPGEDGFAFLRRVRALPPTEGGAIPAIALSAFVRDTDAAKARESGYTTHLGKPVEPAALIAEVGRLAAASQQS